MNGSSGLSCPYFELPNPEGTSISLKNLLDKGPVVVTFYRGDWCPYCNLQLHDLQKHLTNIKELGAELVAISPEVPDKTAATVKKQNLQFYVLSDPDAKVGKQFGLMYQLPPKLIKLYKTLITITT